MGLPYWTRGVGYLLLDSTADFDWWVGSTVVAALVTVMLCLEVVAVVDVWMKTEMVMAMIVVAKNVQMIQMAMVTVALQVEVVWALGAGPTSVGVAAEMEGEDEARRSKKRRVERVSHSIQKTPG